MSRETFSRKLQDKENADKQRTREIEEEVARERAKTNAEEKLRQDQRNREAEARMAREAEEKKAREAEAKVLRKKNEKRIKEEIKPLFDEINKEIFGGKAKITSWVSKDGSATVKIEKEEKEEFKTTEKIGYRSYEGRGYETRFRDESVTKERHTTTGLSLTIGSGDKATLRGRGEWKHVNSGHTVADTESEIEDGLIELLSDPDKLSSSSESLKE